MIDFANATFYVIKLRREFFEACGVLFGFILVGYLISDMIQDLLAQYAMNKLAFFSLQEVFVTKLKLSFFIGLFLSFPIFCYKSWKIFSKEMGNIHPIVTLITLSIAVGLFCTGAFLCYKFVVPLGIKILIGFGGDVLEPFISVDMYIVFCVKLILVFGLIFELPLVMIILSRIGIVTNQKMRKFRKYALLLIAVTSALATPPDIYSQIIVMVPMVLLYEISVLLVRLSGK